MTAPALLFDLDGTLTDPRPGIVRCLRHALGALGMAAPPDEVLASFIGPPLRDTFATLLGTTDRAAVEAAMTRYREEYGATGLFENRVYDGVPALLRQVQGTAAPAFVVTLKPKPYADRIARHLGLAPYLAGVYGPDLEESAFDDKTALLGRLLETEAIAPGRAIMIGDRAGDVAAARAHGVPSIGVLWGYGSAAELAAADELVASLPELAARLARLPLPLDQGR